MSTIHVRPRRRYELLAAIALTGAIAMPALSDDEDLVRPSEGAGATFRVDLEFAHFEGDYGTDETISFDALTTKLRWRWSRAEIRVGLPYVRLSGEAALVGGAPTPSEAGDPGASPGPPGPPSTDEPTARDEFSASGPGDVLVRADYDIVRGSARRPWVTGLAGVKLPTADEIDGLGTGEADVEGGLQLVQPLGSFSLFAEGRYTRIGEPAGIELDDVVRTSIGISRRVGSSARALVYAFWENRTHPVPGRVDRSDVMLGASARLGTERQLRLSGAAYAGLSETAEDWGLQFMLGREF